MAPPLGQPEPRIHLIAVIALAAVLRLAGLGSASLWYDEGASLYAGRYATDPAALFDASKNIEPPVNAIVTGLWAGLVSSLSPAQPTDAANDFLLRLLPCGFGILNCALVYWLALRLFACTATARAAALLFAIAPFQIYYAQELRIYSLYVTLALVATGCMAAALQENRPRHWAGYVASLSLLMYCHFITVWLIFTLNVAFVALLWKYKARFWRWTAANAAVMLLVAPSLYRAFAMHAAVQQIEIPWYPNPTWKTGLITFKNFFAGYSPAAWAYWPLFLVALGLWAAGLCYRRREADGPIITACLTWLPVAGCICLWGRADFSFYEHRLFLFAGVAALIGVARGAVRLGRPGTAALGLLALLMLPGLADYYRGQLHPVKEHRLGVFDKVDFRSAARALEAEWQPGDRLVYATVFSAYSMYHYFPHDQVHIGWDLSLEDVYIKIYGHEALLREHRLMPVPKEEAISGATRIWFLTTHGITFESEAFTSDIRGWLERVATEEQSRSFAGVTLQLFVPQES